MRFFKQGGRKEKPKKRARKEKAKKAGLTAEQRALEEEIKQSKMPILYLKRVNMMLLWVNLFLLCFIVVLGIEHVSLYPIVEKRYSFMELLGREDNFVKVTYSNHFESEGLIKDLILRYIYKREEILKANDVEYVMAYSGQRVKTEYMEIQKELKKRNVRAYRKRHVRFDRYQNIEANIRQIEIITTDYIFDPNSKSDRTPVIEEKRWLINVKFEFSDQTKRLHRLPQNPYGFFIVKYNLSSVKA